MDNQRQTAEPTSKDATTLSSKLHVPWFRCGIGGFLMGLANLVPGLSGGTMILIVGLYDDFISSVADVTRLKFTWRSVLIVGMVGGIAILSIALFAGRILGLMFSHPLAMYSLFIGMTLGGVPMLWKMIKPLNPGSVLRMIAGIAVMVGIALMSTGTAPLTDEEKAILKKRVESGEFKLEPNYALDVTAGVLGMSAMVLPGISGGYMLLLLGRYRQILGAIVAAKTYALSFGKEGDLTWLNIVLPVGIGVLVSVVCVTNILKWLLHHYERQTVALLLGVLLGSAVLLFGRKEVQVQNGWDYATAGGMLLIGLVLTIALGRIGGGEKTGTS